MDAGEWRSVEGWPYEVSSLGYVRRQPPRYRVRGRILKPFVDERGYRRVTLYGLDKPLTLFVHTLVCLAFVGPKPSLLHGVAHWDGDPSNNAATNLRWATIVENLDDCIRQGTRLFGERHPGVKLTENDVREIDRLYASGLPQHKIADMFGVTQSNISVVLLRKSWSHLP